MSELTIRVRFLGELKSLVRRRETEVLVADDTTVGHILEHLCETFGEPLKARLFDGEGKLNHFVSIFINDRVIDNREVIQTRLSGGELDLLVLPVFEGGWR